MIEFAWNDQTIARLRELWASRLSTSKIGEHLGCSKNSVIGKARRLGLEARHNPILVQGSGKKPRSARVKNPSVPTLAPLQSVAVPVIVKAVERLAPLGTNIPTVKAAVVLYTNGEMCCWPLNRGLACDSPTVRGKPYCADHCARAYVGAPVSKNTGLDWTRPDKFRIAR